MINQKCMIRLRVSHEHAHYGGNLVSGGFTVGLFNDVATELLIRLDGDEGFFLRYDEIEYLAPLYAGDFIEVYGWITEIGNTSRKMAFEAYRVVRYLNDPNQISAADFLETPELYLRAKGICVTPKNLQRSQWGNSWRS